MIKRHEERIREVSITTRREAQNTRRVVAEVTGMLPW